MLDAQFNAGKDEDGWHIGENSELTLRMTAESYERLGPGVLASKSKNIKSSMRRARIPLGPSGIPPHTKVSFERWEAYRRENGLFGWDVLITCPQEYCAELPNNCKLYDVKPETVHYNGIRLPAILTSGFRSEVDEEDLTDVLEWLGMIAIQAPRVYVNDSMDPYVCRRSQGEGDGVILAKRVRWRGLLGSQFVTEVFDTFGTMQLDLTLITLHGWPEEGSEGDKKVSWSWIRGREKMIALPARGDR
ncbi:uncharacterized protein EI90DRAFT_140685 [Cantharellus anzutake]|uniref:uncharacterized protein n=1 Tax=Cantharellus anzutake TaxID=1750568 RepID=UPI001907B24F|nr:uncharacterized protein EI90DRAFT_140685 [Cantharellus anzutake]KAF8317762.1 hypothetical protein EI90DRAFT_140685 [Cantharellus anzutake]